MKPIWVLSEEAGVAHRFGSAVEYEYGKSPHCGLPRDGTTWRRLQKGERFRKCDGCVTPEERAELEALRKGLVGREFQLGPGVFELIQLRTRVQGFVGAQKENAWSQRIYAQAEREEQETVPWVTARYKEAITRLEAGSPLEVAGDG